MRAGPFRDRSQFYRNIGATHLEQVNADLLKFLRS